MVEVEPIGVDSVLLKGVYCGVCATDIHIYHGILQKRVSMSQTIVSLVDFEL